MSRALAIAALALGVVAPSAPAAVHVHQMVVFRSGRARVSNPVAAQTTASVRGRRCAVAAATPLAVLINSRIGPLSLRDYGSCSKRPSDGGRLFVVAIGSDRNRGSDGWVYKAGNVLGTAGAGDPAGPLGRGRLRGGAHVTWFWCHVSARDGGCPHTLGIAVTTGSGTLSVHVRAYDDSGRGRAAAGATVHAGGHTAVTRPDGSARLRVPRGAYTVWATQPRRIRSFPTRVRV